MSVLTGMGIWFGFNIVAPLLAILLVVGFFHLIGSRK